MSGPDSVLVGELEPQEQRAVNVQMVALHAGVQRLAALHVYDTRYVYCGLGAWAD